MMGAACASPVRSLLTPGRRATAPQRAALFVVSDARTAFLAACWVAVSSAACGGSGTSGGGPILDAGASPPFDGSVSSPRDGSADATTPSNDAGADAAADTGGPTDGSNPVDAADSGDAGDGGSKDAGAFGGDWPPDGGWGPNANLPYWPTNYDEPYRGQYFFTAPNGWLNDANGLWYYGGVFHLSYQAYPYTLQGLAKHWGHATSPDLVHWSTAPVMLDPGVNVPGDAWSGSTVVDVDNTSGLKTGTNPVLVTLYTATSKGTCLAYSNDLGVTWQPYAGNPLAIGDANANNDRDPHVFWHEPTHQWVCAHYDSGIKFYTSPDLRTWTLQSNISFGFECPDMYELPVDGNSATTKWVVQDGSGSYLLGQFDGKTFTADPGGPYSMDVGPSFYASQTFYRRTFPDSRVVQMAWMRDSNAANIPFTAPWNQAISFPAELNLKTFPEGVRVTRSPIAEISTLYGQTQHFDAEMLPASTNLLSGITSKTYDFELVVDVTHSTASTIQFQLANDTFTYDIKNAQLLGSPLEALNGQVKIRILADWEELAVFGNDGELSYTASFQFTPSDSSLSVTADGGLAIVSADFRQLNRAWPGKAALSSVQLDDADPSTQYSGAWSNLNNDSTYLASTAHVGTAAGSTVTAMLTGTRIEWHGLANVDLGYVDVSVDGAFVKAVDTYSATRQLATLFVAPGLTNGPHTISVAANGMKNPASAGVALVHDFFASYVDP
jgi:sucrose-6-phosphate hydrolase SacC (GH32 family)